MNLRCKRALIIGFSRSSTFYRQEIAKLHRSMSSTHVERTKSSSRDDGIYSAEVLKVDKFSSTVKGLKLKVTEKSFDFKPGQWVDFMIPGLSVVGGFSICSSPSDVRRDSSIQLAVKYSDHPPAKWVHSKCKVGDKVQIRVGGDFHLDLPSCNEIKKDLLFIAGGVGINPLWSMFKFAAENPSSFGQAALLFSAGSSKELLFKDKIIDVCTLHPQFKCHFFVTDKKQEKLDSWTKGGRITKETLKATIDSVDINNVSVYICGPQPMIKYISDSLVDLGVDTAQIHFEKWW